VKRAAVAIETFHKASLVHDDIEDDDAYRYGHETLHRVHGVGTAINVGDYLIGLGYRCVSRDRKALGRGDRRGQSSISSRTLTSNCRKAKAVKLLWARGERQGADHARRAEDLRAEDVPRV